MPVYNQFIDQIIAGTSEDLHGEKYSKEFFEELIESAPDRMPLHQHHNMSKGVLGYLENFRLVPNADEWNVIADIYVTAETVDDSFKGFSFSTTQSMAGNLECPIHNIYLPYPHYNDLDFVDDLVNSDSELMVGKWIKKGLTGLEIGLIATGIAVVVAPEWDIQYRNHVRPALIKLFSFLPKLKAKDIPVDLVQQVEHGPHLVQLYFTPDRSNEESEAESFKEKHFIYAYETAMKFLVSDSKSNSVGAQKIKLYFDNKSKSYKVFHIQYLDGTDASVA
ncbi:hypothetical protein [Vibrio crassostreae]|uniref:hypothetical protein n=1 Tax=Vibrio crassostreae TaxID=246167 RepID=UPI001B30DDB4|nr:hypothetical protein [Vibrio crassostreae]